MRRARQLGVGRLSAWTLAATIFFVVSGGPYSAEQVVGLSGPLVGLLILCAMPLVWAGPVALLTSELVATIPEEGGYYVWVKRALGPFAGFQCAWWSWVSSWVDVALYPLLALEYGSRVVPAIGSGPMHIACIVAIVAVFAWINMFGIRAVGLSSNWMMLLLLAPFVALTVLGIGKAIGGGAHAVPTLNPGWKWTGIGGAVVYALWNFMGWDSLSTASGEVDQAKRQFPKALAISLGLVTAAVVLPVAAGIFLNRDWGSWKADNGYWPEIASSGLAALGPVIAIGGALSGLGLFSANMLASSRLPFVLGQDGYLPHWVTAQHPKYKTPWAGILICAVFAIAFARDSFQNLLATDITLYLVSLILEFVALLILRRRRTPEETGFKIGGGWPVLIALTVVPTLVALGALGLQLDPDLALSSWKVAPILLTLAFLVSGPIAYAALRGRFRTSDA